VRKKGVANSELEEDEAVRSKCRCGADAAQAASSPAHLPTRPSPTSYRSRYKLLHRMGRDETLDTFVETLELLVPIAKAVPILGSTVEGSLEAAIKVIQFTQVRQSPSLSKVRSIQHYAGRAQEQAGLARARARRSALDRGARQGAEQRAAGSTSRAQKQC
jgi:hypothetical protein